MSYILERRERRDIRQLKYALELHEGGVRTRNTMKTEVVVTKLSEREALEPCESWIPGQDSSSTSISM